MVRPASLLFLLSLAGPVSAGDWPQILGPSRNGIAEKETLADRWPANGPAVVWRQKVGSGFAAPVVRGETLYLFQRRGNRDQLAALEAATGKLRWSQEFPSDYQAQIVEDDGPRATPVVYDEAAYTYSAQGELRCHDAATGKVRWERSTHQDFKAAEGYFGAGSTPLVFGDLLIVNVGGGREKAGVVAFERASGKTVWKSVADDASYSSPVTITRGDQTAVVVLSRLQCSVLNPLDGTPLGQFRFGQRGPTVNGANPLVIGDQIFLTASYGIGCDLVRWDGKTLEGVWHADDLISTQYMTPIYLDGHLYAVDGRQDHPGRSLKCIHLADRKVTWSEENQEYGSLILADGKLVLVHTDGTVRLLKANPEKREELGRFSLPRGTYRALPALANGFLYVRNETELLAVSLAPAQ